MKVLRTLLRIFSYVFNGLFAAVALMMAAIILASGPQTVNFYLLPLTGRNLVYGLLAAAFVGFLVLMAAIRGKAQMLYVAWTVLTLVLVVRYFFFSDYSYIPETGDYRFAIYAVLAGFVAAFGASVRPVANSR